MLHWFFILFLASMAFADSGEKVLSGYEPRRDNFSEKHTGGPFLIYDCEDEHWVCVLEANYQNCLELRKEDDLGKRFDYRCAPIGEYPTKKACFQQQLYRVSQAMGKTFCIKDEWKERDVRY